MSQVSEATQSNTPFSGVKALPAASGKQHRRQRPVIGIVPTQHVDTGRTSISERYATAVAAAGGAPLLLPVTQDLGVYETLFPLIDGFVLSGGQDIDPARYSDDAVSDKLSEFTPIREELEYLILSYAYEFDVPLLGVCRGMQMINVFFGGTLYLDVPDQFAAGRRGVSVEMLRHWQQESYDTRTHGVVVDRDSKLGEILGVERTTVNSMHHQGVRQVGPGLRAVARATDGLVEGIEAKERTMIIGVQWHPEFLTETNPIMCKLFEAFTTQALRCQRGSSLSRLSISQQRWAGYSWPVTDFGPRE